jgi:hypothetical protein
VRNPRAIWAFLFALLALGALFGGAAAARLSERVGFVEAVGAVPLGVFLAFVSLSLARRARYEYQRTVGRAGGAGLAAVARVLGAIALLIGVTAALALGVFAVLALVLDGVLIGRNHRLRRDFGRRNSGRALR